MFGFSTSLQNSFHRIFLAYLIFAVGEATVSGQDKKDADAIYDKMVKTLQKAKTASWKSEYTIESRGRARKSSYQIELQKPNFFRVISKYDDGKSGGIMVGDGKDVWVYWPEGRPMYGFSDEPDLAVRKKQYFRLNWPQSKRSISHRTNMLARMSMLVVEPSIFHGYRDNMDASLDSSKYLRTEKIGDHECDVILRSFLKGQRTRTLWISTSDHLPRKLIQKISASREITTTEIWSDVQVNGKIDKKHFVWQPPKSWSRWYLPKASRSLVKAGKQAPEFKLAGLDGRDLQLSKFRDKVVWLCIWRLG